MDLWRQTCSEHFITLSSSWKISPFPSAPMCDEALHLPVFPSSLCLVRPLDPVCLQNTNYNLDISIHLLMYLVDSNVDLSIWTLHVLCSVFFLLGSLVQLVLIGVCLSWAELMSHLSPMKPGNDSSHVKEGILHL